MPAEMRGHAYGRASERLQMSPREVAELLDHNLIVLLGQEKGSTRMHKLFYSTHDRNWFVAVQDEKNGFVVTILSVAYENRFHISHHALEKARVLVEGETPAVEVEAITAEEDDSVRLHFAAVFVDQNKHRREVKIGKIPASGVGEDPLEEERVVELLKSGIREKILSREKVVCVYAKKGKRGDIIILNLRRLGW